MKIENGNIFFNFNGLDLPVGQWWLNFGGSFGTPYSVEKKLIGLKGAIPIEMANAVFLSAYCAMS